MTGQQIQLLRSVTVTLDGSGNGTCDPLGPSSSGETWQLSGVSVQCSTNTAEALASVYLNGSLIGTTTWGSTGDTGVATSLVQVMTGQQITAAWTGGDPGAVATMTVLGTRTVT
jgi:hypothetical protein